MLGFPITTCHRVAPAPTFVDDLVPGTLYTIESGAPGLLHLTNQGETISFDLTREIAELAGHDSGLVKPTTRTEFDQPHPSQNSVLDSERLARLGIEPLPGYMDKLHATLKERPQQLPH